jgi:hypothetical protein
MALAPRGDCAADYLGVHFSTPGSAGNANGPYVNNDVFYRLPKHVRFTAADRRAVRTVLARFVGSAVARCNVGASWDLAGPSLREGTSRAGWRKGDIPVVPYPAARHGRGSWDLVDIHRLPGKGPKGKVHQSC